MDILTRETSNKRPAPEDERYEGFYPKLQKRRHYEYTVEHDEIEAESEKRYPGDKSYKSPEYSEQFHKQGTIRPIVTFGSNFKPPVVTTAHLVKQLPNVTPDSNLSVTMSKKIRQAKEQGNTEQKERFLNAEQNEVVRLDDWSPADPLKPPNFEQVSKRYGPNSIGFIRRVSNAGSTPPGHTIGKMPVSKPVSAQKKRETPKTAASGNSRKTDKTAKSKRKS